MYICILLVLVLWRTLTDKPIFSLIGLDIPPHHQIYKYVYIHTHTHTHTHFFPTLFFMEGLIKPFLNKCLKLAFIMFTNVSFVDLKYFAYINNYPMR